MNIQSLTTIEQVQQLPTATGMEGLPEDPAVYFALRGDAVIYIGQCRSLLARWRGHTLRRYLCSGEIVVAWFVVPDPETRKKAEASLTKVFRPSLDRVPVRLANLVSKKHAQKTHCPKGHPLSGDNLYQPPADSPIRKQRTQRICRQCRREWWIRKSRSLKLKV